MDGVICDFNKRYIEVHGGEVDNDLTPEGKPRFCRKLFKRAVMEDRIFEKLDWMPNGKELISNLNGLPFSDVTILSSTACVDDIELGLAVVEQKRNWLENNRFPSRSIFTIHKGIKASFATPMSILIDDTRQNIDDFINNGGRAVYYSDSNYVGCMKSILENYKNVLQEYSIGLYDGKVYDEIH